jgi:tetratricopeptide (TPR) repeat protein
MKRLAIAVLALAIVCAVALNADAARSKKLKSDGTADDDMAKPMLPLAPNEIEAYNRGVDALDKKEYDRARKYFEAALQLNEKFPEAHNNLAFALRMLSLDNADASLTHYARALELAPGFPQALYYRGILYVQLGRPADAEKDRAALESQEDKEAQNYAGELAKIISKGKAKSSQDALSIYGQIAP